MAAIENKEEVDHPRETTISIARNSKPNTLNANGSEYTIYHTTGKVAETGKNLETKVHGGGGGGVTYGGTGGSAPVSISSTTVVHDQIFIVDKNGTEHSYQLADFDVACREGNELTVIWAVKQGKPSGAYVAVMNHTTRQNFFNDKALQGIFRFNLWLFLGVGAGLGFMIDHFFLYPVVGMLIGFSVWKSVFNSKGAKRFKSEIAKYIED